MNRRSMPVFRTAFGTYRATAVIGEGGAGRVFAAQDTDDADEVAVAVKLLDSSKVTREKLKRFKNEYSFCSRSIHRNIVSVLDYGLHEDDSRPAPFYVMPLYAGSLRKLMQAGLDPERALRLFGQILDGVEAAHLQGVVHRDLKPENVLYDDTEDRLVLADFGIAQFAEDELFTLVETRPGTRLANFQYSAPEQRQRGGTVDRRADIYALGLMLNELFTGEVPLGTDYRTVGATHPELGYLDEIVAVMIRQSPDRRPSTIEEVKTALIAREQQFITRQRISELEGTVVPTTEVDDPLIADPPRIIDFDWAGEVLSLKFQRPVNQEWVLALQNMGSHTAILGKGPEAFRITGDTAQIHATSSEVQRLIDHFKGWLPRANAKYAETIRAEAEAAETAERARLRAELERQKERERVLRETKV